MIGVGEFGERIVVGRHLYPRIVDLQLLQRLSVVIDNHALRPDHRHLPHFLGVQPTVMNEGAAVLRKGQIHHRDVLDAPRHMAAPLARDTHWPLVQQVQQDRNVVRRKVPRHVDILLKQPQVQPPRRDVLHLADVTRIDDLLHAPHRGREQEGVPHHHHQALAFGQRHDFFGLRLGPRHRLLNEDVLARAESGHGHLIMEPHGCRDHHRIKVRAVQQILETTRGRNLGIQPPHVAQALLARIADEFELAVRGLPQVTD